MDGSKFRTALIVAGLLTLSMISTIPMVSAETTDSITWGVEYEWANLNGDIQGMTGLPYDDIIEDIEESANYGGFNLTILNVYSGSSSMYVEQWDDSTEQQITDNSGDSHTVTSRVTEVTLRHGMLYDAGFMVDWKDNTVMGAPSMEMVLSADYETILVMDLLYTEYVTSDMMLVGSDLDASANLGVGAGMGFYADISGNGDSFEMDLDAGIDLGWSANSINSEWRLEHPSNILNMMNNGNNFDWECGTLQCGKISGSFATATSYEISLTGLPMDEFGFEADALDLQISDTIPDSGTFDSDSDDMIMDDGLEFELPYSFDGQQTITIDDGGTTTEATEVMMDPFSPGMSLMVGYSFANAVLGSGDQTTADEAMMEAFTAWTEDAEETIVFDTFTCDDGEEIPSDYVNDGEDDCADGSDEGVDEGELATELENMAMNIYGAFEESDFTKNLETVGERLEFEMEKYEDIEADFPYVDGDYAALWSNEHSRFVGFQLLGETESGNVYSVLGPETSAYNNNPPVQIHLEYLVGAAAEEAETAAETAITIEELAPVAAHDVSAIVTALGSHAPESMIVEPPAQAEDGGGESDTSMEDSGGMFGLPAPGFISVVFVVIGAAMVARIMPRRQE